MVYFIQLITMINIAHPEIGDEEISAVNAVLASGTLAQGPRVAKLEEDFAQYCGTKYAVAVSSGTAAIHSALYAAGVRAGEELVVNADLRKKLMTAGVETARKYDWNLIEPDILALYK